MVKISILLTRRPNLTHEEFVEYWTGKHTPLLASLPPGTLSVSRYVQLQPTGEQIPGVTTADYDGVAELWVESVADAAAWFGTPQPLLGYLGSSEEFAAADLEDGSMRRCQVDTPTSSVGEFRRCGNVDEALDPALVVGEQGAA